MMFVGTFEIELNDPVNMLTVKVHIRTSGHVERMGYRVQMAQ